MKFTIAKSSLLPALQMVTAVVDKKPSFPIVSNVLLRFKGDVLHLTGTDCDIELSTQIQLEHKVEPFEITLPGRKWLDICRSLPDEALIEISFEQARCKLRSDKSRFTLSTLPAHEFPNVEIGTGILEFSVQQQDLRTLIEHTYFAMGQQDVRHYLNGMLFEVGKNEARTVAADGHRLSTVSLPLAINQLKTHQVILPRKGVVELLRLLGDADDEISLVICSNHLRIVAQNYSFLTKLVDGRYPDYHKVVPLNVDKTVLADRELLKQALQRAAILSNEKARSIRVQLSNGFLKISGTNPEQDESEDEIPVDYAGLDLEIGLNVGYLLDVLNVINTDKVDLRFGDSDTSVLMEESTENKEGLRGLHVIMPMRL